MGYVLLFSAEQTPTTYCSVIYHVYRPCITQLDESCGGTGAVSDSLQWLKAPLVGPQMGIALRGPAPHWTMRLLCPRSKIWFLEIVWRSRAPGPHDPLPMHLSVRLNYKSLTWAKSTVFGHGFKFTGCSKVLTLIHLSPSIIMEVCNFCDQWRGDSLLFATHTHWYLCLEYPNLLVHLVNILNMLKMADLHWQCSISTPRRALEAQMTDLAHFAWSPSQGWSGATLPSAKIFQIPFDIWTFWNPGFMNMIIPQLVILTKACTSCWIPTSRVDTNTVRHIIHYSLQLEVTTDHARNTFVHRQKMLNRHSTLHYLVQIWSNNVRSKQMSTQSPKNLRGYACKYQMSLPLVAAAQYPPGSEWNSSADPWSLVHMFSCGYVPFVPTYIRCNFHHQHQLKPNKIWTDLNMKQFWSHEVSFQYTAAAWSQLIQHWFRTRCIGSCGYPHIHIKRTKLKIDKKKMCVYPHHICIISLCVCVCVCV